MFADTPGEPSSLDSNKISDVAARERDRLAVGGELRRTVIPGGDNLPLRHLG